MHDAIQGQRTTDEAVDAAGIQGMLVRIHEALRETDQQLLRLRDRIEPVLTPADLRPDGDEAALRTIPACSTLLQECTRALEVIQEQQRALVLLCARVEL